MQGQLEAHPLLRNKVVQFHWASFAERGVRVLAVNGAGSVLALAAKNSAVIHLYRRTSFQAQAQAQAQDHTQVASGEHSWVKVGELGEHTQVVSSLEFNSKCCDLLLSTSHDRHAYVWREHQEKAAMGAFFSTRPNPAAGGGAVGGYSNSACGRMLRNRLCPELVEVRSAHGLACGRWSPSGLKCAI